MFQEKAPSRSFFSNCVKMVDIITKKWSVWSFTSVATGLPGIFIDKCTTTQTEIMINREYFVFIFKQFVLSFLKDSAIQIGNVVLSLLLC